MEGLVDLARRVLARHPSPALPYPGLHRLVCVAVSGPRPDPALLLRRIRARPELFRIVEPWRGPWRRFLDGEDGDATSYRNALEDAGLPSAPWIVGRSVGAGDGGGGAVWERRLRSSLLLLGRRVDPGSTRRLSRWVLLLREERTLRERLPAAVSHAAPEVTGSEAHRRRGARTF